MVESHESTRQRTESLQPISNEDRTAGKGFTSLTHYNLVHQVFSDATKHEDSRCKSCRGQGMEEARNNPSMKIGKKSMAKRRVILEAQRVKKKVQFAAFMDICHRKNAELEPKTTEVQRQGRVLRRRRERRLWSLRRFY